jgi:hypothetical protein
MKWIYVAVLVFAPFVINLQSATPPADPFASLHFLEGTWQAQAQGAQGAAASGRYTFKRELGGHVLTRHSTSDPNCTGPVSFDCQHSDLLYVFQDGGQQPLKAIYFDSEGHTIHYDVTISGPSSVVFESESGPGPRFRLTYELKSGMMNGKFQMQPPGTNEWHSYLEWTGARN